MPCNKKTLLFTGDVGVLLVEGVAGRSCCQDAGNCYRSSADQLVSGTFLEGMYSEGVPHQRTQILLLALPHTYLYVQELDESKALSIASSYFGGSAAARKESARRRMAGLANEQLARTQDLSVDCVLHLLEQHSYVLMCKFSDSLTVAWFLSNFELKVVVWPIVVGKTKGSAPACTHRT